MTDYKAQVTAQIKWYPLKDSQYLTDTYPKKTILLHHTAGNANPYGVVDAWNVDTLGPIATAFIVGGKSAKSQDGESVQCFSSKYWAYHLGLKAANMPPGSLSNVALNGQAVGIEICNWGPLTLKNGQYLTYVNSVLPSEQVCDLGYSFRGFQYWHAYTPAQLATVKLLVLYLTETYNIPRDYKGIEMFSVNSRAFTGETGIWTHTSYRQDKTDCYPHPSLIQMLTELKNG